MPPDTAVTAPSGSSMEPHSCRVQPLGCFPPERDGLSLSADCGDPSTNWSGQSGEPGDVFSLEAPHLFALAAQAADGPVAQIEQFRRIRPGVTQMIEGIERSRGIVAFHGERREFGCKLIAGFTG